MRNLAINPERLWNELMETAAIGGTAKGGICRLTLTDLDREVRDWFRRRTVPLRCTLRRIRGTSLVLRRARGPP